MKYHITVNKILNLLRESNVWFVTFEHEPVRTSEQAAQIRVGYSLKQGAKALIVRVKTSLEKYFVMLVVPGDRKFDTNRVKKVFNAKDVRFATLEEVGKITGDIESGGVPPFGNLFKLQTVVDPTLFLNKKIVFNAGDRRFSVAMEIKNYVDLVKPKVIKIT